MAHSGILKPSRLGWVILALAVFIVVFSLVTADGPYRGRVIDAETKEPIEGAAVVAVWIREVWVGIQSNQWFAYAHEVVTNDNGEFTMPGLPLTRRLRLFFNPLDWLDTGQPEFYILKPGYGWYPRHHLNPPKGSKQEMLEHFNSYTLIELPLLSIQKSPKEIEELRLNLPHCPFGGMEGVPSMFIPEYINYINTARERIGLSGGTSCS